MARYWVGTSVSDRLGARFPFGTLVINLTACVIIGFALTVLNRHTEFNPAIRYLVPFGFVGAYSTFSTFEWEIFTNLNSGAFWVAILYAGSSLVFGLVAVAVGAMLGKVVP
jgi:CrcB protein